MSAPTTEHCPYIEDQKNPPCPGARNPETGFCDTHDGPRFAICAGQCGEHGTHLCSCGASLCGACIHHPPTTNDPADMGWHGRREAAEGVYGNAPAGVTRLRDEMAKAVMLSLRKSTQENVLDDYERAVRVVNDVGVTIAWTMLSGMAGAPQKGTEE